MNLEDLLSKNPKEPGTPPEGFENYPPFRMPTMEEVTQISRKYNCPFPPSFIKYQTDLGKYIADPEGLGWASPEVPAYMSLESIIKGACECEWEPDRWLVPFAEDEGNFYCFDTRFPDSEGEFPVVFWDHDEANVLNVDHLKWQNFAHWLKRYYEN